MTVDDLLPSALPAANALYDAEVAYADASFGRFLALLARHGLDRDAIIVFVADHGEQFLEHGGWRHRDLFGEVTHIPLVIKVPASLGGRAGATAEPASQIDLLPTLADVVGFPVPEASAGKSLLPALVPGRGRVARRPIHAHNLREEREEWSVVDGTYKLIWRHHRRYHETLLYDLAQDLAETTDLAAEQPVRRAYLEALIAQERFGLAPLFEQPRGIPTEELRRRMRALGYVQ